MPGEGFTTWNYTDLAQHFYKKYHYDDVQEQDKKFEEVVKKIIEVTETEYQNSNLEKLSVWP